MYDCGNVSQTMMWYPSIINPYQYETNANVAKKSV